MFIKEKDTREGKDTFVRRKKLFRPVFRKEGRENLNISDDDLTVDRDVENDSLWIMREATLIIKYASNRPFGEEDNILDENIDRF